MPSPLPGRKDHFWHTAINQKLEVGKAREHTRLALIFEEL